MKQQQCPNERRIIAVESIESITRVFTKKVASEKRSESKHRERKRWWK